MGYWVRISSDIKGDHARTEVNGYLVVVHNVDCVMHNTTWVENGKLMSSDKWSISEQLTGAKIVANIDGLAAALVAAKKRARQAEASRNGTPFRSIAASIWPVMGNVMNLRVFKENEVRVPATTCGGKPVVLSLGGG
jgi:hypothetical protein